MTKEERIRYHKKNPWSKHLVGILNRCGKIRSYLKIKNFLHTKDLKYLWFRDKAYLMERPSIHRLDSFGHYIIKNCKFIEFSEHCTHPKNRLNGKWSYEYDKCVSCGKTDREHYAFGLCAKCYCREWRRINLKEE